MFVSHVGMLDAICRDGCNRRAKRRGMGRKGQDLDLSKNSWPHACNVTALLRRSDVPQAGAATCGVSRRLDRPDVARREDDEALDVKAYKG